MDVKHTGFSFYYPQNTTAGSWKIAYWFVPCVRIYTDNVLISAGSVLRLQEYNRKRVWYRISTHASAFQRGCRVYHNVFQCLRKIIALPALFECLSDSRLDGDTSSVLISLIVNCINTVANVKQYNWYLTDLIDLQNNPLAIYYWDICVLFWVYSWSCSQDRVVKST